MADSTAIKVENVYKDFVLPHERTNSLKSTFTNLFRKNKKTKEVQHALKDISFEIKQGEFFGIVGRNGSGKSTLLKILAGIYQPTKGKKYTNGKLVPFIELGVGFNPELTGRENVYLNGAMLGFSKKEIDGMYDDIVAFAELERFMDQKLKNYSSGMQVRLAFSMATRSEADILLVDEVLAVGDADFQRKCFDYFRTLKKNKKTVVFVTHDMNAVREYCDRATLIDNSKIVTIGDPARVATSYTKLFNTDLKGSEQAAQKNRWGNKDVTIEAPVVNLNDNEKAVSLQFKITAQRPIDNPIVGFVIKNASGVNIAGSNSNLLSKKLGRLESGECATITFQVQNMFSDGVYSIDIAVTSDDGITVADWWEDAASMKIFKDQISPYLTMPEMKMTIEKG